MRNPVSFLAVSQTHCANRAVKWNARNHERCRCCVDCQHIMRISLVCTNNGDYDLSFVAVTIWESWSQRTVCKSACENCLLTWTTFAAKERARDFSRCVSALFNVNCQRKEVNAITHALSGVRCCKNCCLTDSCYYCSLRLQSEFACLKCECSIGP